MEITFIVPAKNEEKRIPYCLEAIRAVDKQNHRIQVIVVDNGSSDNTVCVARNHRAQVHVQENATIAQMRNFGASRATGDILVFVDSDVVVAKDFLSCSLPHFDKAEVGMVTGRIGIPTDSSWVARTWELGRRKSIKLDYINWASSMNMLVKRDLFHQIGGFSESLITCEDVDFSNKLRLQGRKILYDDSVVVTHLGEAKDLIGLYLKEKWRGRSLASIRLRGTSLRQLLPVAQFYIFSLTLLLSLPITIYAGPTAFSWSLPLLLSFPLYRSVKTVCHGGKVRFFAPLMLVWTVYYLARSVSLWQGHFGNMRSCRRLPLC